MSGRLLHPHTSPADRAAVEAEDAAAEPWALLDQLERALTGARPGRIPSPDSYEPVGEHERSSLVMDGLWTTDDYPEYSQQEVLRAYRLGAEDQRVRDFTRLSVAVSLVAAVRAVLDLADELDGYTRNRGRPAPGSYDYGVNLAQADAAKTIRTAVTAALAAGADQ